MISSPYRVLSSYWLLAAGVEILQWNAFCIRWQWVCQCQVGYLEEAEMKWNICLHIIDLISNTHFVTNIQRRAECKWVNWKCSSPSAVTSYKWYPNCPSAFIWKLLVPVPVSAAQTNKMQLFVQCITYLKRGVWNEKFSFCSSSYRKLSRRVGRKERVCCNVVL